MSRTGRLLLSLCTVLATACTPRYAPLEAPSKYYVASFQLEHERGAVKVGGGEVLNERVHQDMAENDLAIAFYPPERCLNTTSAPSGSAEQAEVLGLGCGVLMTEMEAQAAKAGYAVVSWQLLKDAANPLQQARDLDVDLLFEVNELATKQRREEERLFTGINFYEQISSSERVPVTVENVQAVGPRCESAIAHTLQGNQRDFASLSVKLVSCKDGRALWFYERSMGDDAEERQSSFDAYFEAEPSIRAAGSSKLKNAGDVLAGLGATMLLASVVPMTSRAVGGTLQDAEALERVMQISGGLMVSGGVGLQVGGNYGARQTAHYPTADDVLCSGDYTTRNVFLPAEKVRVADARPVDTSGTGYQSERSALGSTDARADRQEELIRRLVQDFLVELDKL